MVEDEIKLNVARKMLLKNECDSDDDLHVGSNCRFLHFSNDKAEIKKSEESQFGLLEVVERKDNKFILHIIQKNEFDLTQLRFEKGFMFNKDGSVTSASAQAFEINHNEIKIEKKKFQYEGIHECKHETATECKRSLIFDVKLSADYSEWISASIGLSHENSSQTLKQHMKYTKHSYERIIRGVISISDKVKAVKNFTEDIKNVVNDKTHDNENDKISKLCEISGKYGHFYARRLILGGTIIRHEEYTKNSVEDSKTKTTNAQTGVGIAKDIFKAKANATYGNKDMYTSYHNNTKNFETIIGGADYSQDDKNSWTQSLNDATKWKIIGYEEVHSLFELLEDKLKIKVLNIMGHQILEAKVDEIHFNIKEYETNKEPYIHNLL
ncbi:6471_t:CDS:2, partial [Dentiscutata heterogama]